MRSVLFTSVLLALGGVGNAWGQVQYTVTDLGMLSGGTSSSADGINSSGQVVGGSTATGGVRSAFLYSGGTMQNLGSLPGCLNSAASSINDSGQAVGLAFNLVGTPDSLSGVQATDEHALLFSGGSLQDLNNLIPSNSGWTLQTANDINDNGQIVGQGINPNV